VAQIVAEKGLNKSKMHVLAALTRLRQICCHPTLVGNDSPSGKTETLFELLEPLLAQGQKVLIFSQFVQMLKLLETECKTRQISTHILTDVERVCDRVAILDHGRLVTTGLMAELLDRYARPIYRVEPEDGQLDAFARLTESLRAASFVTHVTESSAGLRVAVSEAPNAGRDLLAMVAAHGVALLVFERQRPTLEDVFLQLVGRRAHEPEAAA